MWRGYICVCGECVGGGDYVCGGRGEGEGETGYVCEWGNGGVWVRVLGVEEGKGWAESMCMWVGGGDVCVSWVEGGGDGRGCVCVS